MNNKEKMALVPKFRFPEFRVNGEWQITTLNNLANKVAIRNKDNSINRVFTNSAIEGVIDQSDYFDREVANPNNLDNYFVIDKNDYVYNPRISATAPVGPISKNKIGKGVMSPLYIVFRFKNHNSDFYEQYFKTSLWHNYLKSVSNTGARHDRISISNDTFMKLPLPYHAEAEQQKIADCLSSLDELLTAEDKKLHSLKIHKKCLMQKIFSQKLRFTRAGGSSYPDWNIFKIDDLGELYSGLSGKSKEDFGSGQAFITYMNVYKNTFIDKEEVGYVKIKNNETQNKVQKGDILWTTSSETPDEVGITSYVDEDLKDYYLNSFCFGFRLSDKISKFLAYYFRSPIFRKKIRPLAQGAIRYNLSKRSLVRLEITIPTDKEEQKKIADCLSSLDELITAQAEKIKALKLHKKGLMQGLFPSFEEAGE